MAVTKRITDRAVTVNVPAGARGGWNRLAGTTAYRVTNPTTSNDGFAGVVELEISSTDALDFVTGENNVELVGITPIREVVQNKPLYLSAILGTASVETQIEVGVEVDIEENGDLKFYPAWRRLVATEDAHSVDLTFNIWSAPRPIEELRWRYDNADTVVFDQGIGTVESTGRHFVDPEVTTTYTATVTNAKGSITDEHLVQIGPQAPVVSGSPTINDYSFEGAETAPLGTDRVINYDVDNALRVAITPNIGTLEAHRGSVTVSPVESTNYVLTAENLAGVTTETLRAVVAGTPVSTTKAVINAFSVSNTALTRGGKSTVSWQVTGATTVTLNGETVAASGSREVSPRVTTEYTLVATNAAGSISERITVNVSEPAPTPTVARPTGTLTVNPASARSGFSRTLSWNISGATRVNISGIGTNLGNSGSRTVSPTSTTTYTLEATNAGGTTTITAIATVTVAPPVADPVINSATFTAGSSPFYGGRGTLRWQTTGATRVSINQGIGSVTVDGSRSVNITRTTTWTITATNSVGVSRTLTVTGTVLTRPSRPTVNSLTISPNAGTSSTQRTTVSWSVTGATSISISGIGSGLAASGSRTVTPGRTRTYTLTATNAGGAITRSVTYTLRAVAPPPPAAIAVTTLSTNPSQLRYPGRFTVTYATRGASTVNFRMQGRYRFTNTLNNLYNQSVPLSGSQQFFIGTATYDRLVITITAAGAGGTVTRTLTKDIQF